MLSIFITSFINTGIILLFCNANLQYSVLSFLHINLFYPDIDRNWYIDIGPSLVQTMLISAFYPYIDITIQIMTKAVSKYLDSGFYCCRDKHTHVTKTKTAD
jgi:hypothetical protein